VSCIGTLQASGPFGRPFLSPLVFLFLPRRPLALLQLLLLLLLRATSENFPPPKQEELAGWRADGLELSLVSLARVWTKLAGVAVLFFWLALFAFVH